FCACEQHGSCIVAGAGYGPRDFSMERDQRMAGFKTLDDIGAVSGKRVLVRVDLNVPVADGKVTDATRIERIAPTVAELSGKGAKVILLAHFGRPKDGPSTEFSLEPIAKATA